MSSRKGLWRAYGIDPLTLARKAYYGNSSGEAEGKAKDSYEPKVKEDTFAAYYFKGYLPTVEHRSENWQNQIGWAMDKHVLPTFGEHPLSSIERPELQRLFNKLLRKMATSSVGKIKIIFSGVMNLAVADKKIPVNPVRFVKLPTAEEPEKISLTYEELARLYLVSKPELRVIVLLSAIAAGLRIGEACGTSRMLLTSDDVLHVRQQVLQLKGGARITKKLKTPQTKRSIPLPAELAAAIREEARDRFYLAGTSRNKFQLPNNVTEDLALACIAARIPAITPHELRHTFISLLENEMEAPDAIVAALAGKKDKRVNSGYSHTHRKQLLKWLGLSFTEFQKQLEKIALQIELQGQTA